MICLANYVIGSFKIFEETCPNIVTVDSNGILTGRIVDLCKSLQVTSLAIWLTNIVLLERVEMASMTRASEIAPNVFLGPTPDPSINPTITLDQFDVLIEASDLAQIPDAKTLTSLRSVLSDPQRPTVQFEVPGSGSIMPPTWSHIEVDGLLNVCKWIWDISNDDTIAGASSDSCSDVSPASENDSDELAFDSEGDIIMQSAPAVQLPRTPRKVLIHCADGYTESTLLGVTYFMFAHGLPVFEAWIRLHRELRRNFFAYPTDVALLTSIQPRILTESPAKKTQSAPCLALSSIPVDPEWLAKLDGSLPSRVLDYMYLGNLSHANNPGLLRELGIRRIVSVGEKVAWPDRGVSEVKTVEGGNYDGFEFVIVENVQDNGVDSLSEEFERCLDFIGMFSYTRSL
jgi:dual specificity MAP kinase phosphatase